MMCCRGLLRACAGIGFLALAACRAPDADHQAIQRAAEVHGEVTVAGCLRDAEQPGQFVLANAVLAHEQAGTPVRDGEVAPEPLVGTPGTTGTIPATVRGPSYTVEPPGGVHLQAHVGRQVQVTGRLEAPSGAGEPVGTTGTAGEYGEPREAPAGVHGHLAASEVRLIAHTCM